MSEYRASIEWQCDAASFTGMQYSRRHTWSFDGGARVLASSSPQVVPPPASDPAGVDPEEAFVASLASCHMLWFLDLAARAGWQVQHYRDDATGLMGRNAEGRLAMTRVTLRPAVGFGGASPPAAAEQQRLHHQAHERCFIANSVKTEVRCEPVLPG